MLMHPAALQCGNTGAALLQNFVICKHFQEGIDLIRLADQLKHHAVRRKVDDLGLVDAGDLPQLAAVVHIGCYLQQQQFPFQRFFAVQHEHLTGNFQPFGLQDQLAECLFVAGDGNGDAADRRVVGSRNGQAVNVEAASANTFFW